MLVIIIAIVVLAILTEGFSSPLFAGGCPQIDVPMKETGRYWPHIGAEEYEGWKLSPYDFFGAVGSDIIPCHKGDREGQIPEYWYCGADERGVFSDPAGAMSDQKLPLFFKRGVIIKTYTNPDGSIGKTTRRLFYNVYDENRQFVKTVCGDDPNKAAEKGGEALKDAVRDFWN